MIMETITKGLEIPYGKEHAEIVLTREVCRLYHLADIEQKKAAPGQEQMGEIYRQAARTLSLKGSAAIEYLFTGVARSVVSPAYEINTDPVWTDYPGSLHPLDCERC